MKKRPICIIKKCGNLVAKHYKRKDGSWVYRKLCCPHHRRKYNMSRKPTDFLKQKEYSRYGEVADMDHSECSLCGWDKAECDRHRMKFGCDGGKYTLGNTISVCPNCHRLIHRGKLKIK